MARALNQTGILFSFTKNIKYLHRIRPLNKEVMKRSSQSPGLSLTFH